MIMGSCSRKTGLATFFQLLEMVQSEATQCVNTRVSTFFPKIKGAFGMDFEKEWTIYFRNEF